MLRYRDRYRERRNFQATDESAVGYVRCGLPDDRRVSYSSESLVYREQRNVIRRYARKANYYVWRVFSDRREDESVGLGDRPGLQALLLEMASKKIRRLLVDRADRLTNDPLVLAPLLAYLRSRHIQVVEAISGKDLTADLDLPQAFAGANPPNVAGANKAVGLFKRQMYSLRKGSRHFGCQAGEADIVKRILELRRKLPKDQQRRYGKKIKARPSFAVIAAILNHEGLKTRAGKPWTPGSVRNIVARERPSWLA